MSKIGQFGTSLVDALPLLDALPDWLAPWKADADAFNEFESRLYIDLARRALQAGGAVYKCVGFEGRLARTSTFAD